MRMNQEMDDDEKGKLFVGGLSWETSQENLQQYFSRFGEVIDCVVMKQSETGRSRGFGFVTYSDPSRIDVVLQSGPHHLDGRTIDPKPCNPRTLQKPKHGGGGYPKVFLGGLPSHVTETELKAFFGRYGNIMEVVIMYDQEKKKSRGFGFLSFEDEQSVERVTREHFINLNGKQVEVKRAEPRDGSGRGGFGGSNTPQGGQWGRPGTAPVQAHNGQMGGQGGGYQGWDASGGQSSYGYGTAGAGPGNYQGWGAPPGPQGAPAWPSANNYSQPSAQGYSSYANYSSPQAAPAPAGNNWSNWNMPQNSNGSAASYAPMAEGSQMYGGAPALSKSSTDLSSYQQGPPVYQGSSYAQGEFQPMQPTQPPGDDSYQRSLKRPSVGSTSAPPFHPYRR